MNLLTSVFFVSGLNRVLLLERLKKNGVRVLEVKNIDEKSFEITIDNKDCDKFFAICKKRWYNKKIRVGGLFAPLWKILRAPFLIVACVLFAALCIFSDKVFLKAEYKSDALLYQSDVLAAFEDAEIKRGSFFDEGKLKIVQKALADKNDFAFLKIQKCGNKAIIEIKKSDTPPLRITGSEKDVVAAEDIKILKISAYSGTVLVSCGDEIKKGTPIIGAYEIINEQNAPCKIFGFVLAEAKFCYEYECKFAPEDADVCRAVSAAKFMLGDYEVLRSQSRIKDKKIIVELYYEKIIFGG